MSTPRLRTGLMEDKHGRAILPVTSEGDRYPHASPSKTVITKCAECEQNCINKYFCSESCKERFLDIGRLKSRIMQDIGSGIESDLLADIYSNPLVKKRALSCLKLLFLQGRLMFIEVASKVWIAPRLPSETAIYNQLMSAERRLRKMKKTGAQ